MIHKIETRIKHIGDFRSILIDLHCRCVFSPTARNLYDTANSFTPLFTELSTSVIKKNISEYRNIKLRELEKNSIISMEDKQWLIDFVRESFAIANMNDEYGIHNDDGELENFD